MGIIIFLSSTNMAASTSQNFPRTFFRLQRRWDEKVGRRNVTAGIWSDTTFNRQQAPSYDRVPHIMEHLFQQAEFAEVLKSVSPNTKLSPDEQSVWVYDMRNSDAIPRTIQDEKRLYEYVKLIIANSFPQNSGRQIGTPRSYLEDNIHVAVCFFVWCLTKPNFFFKDKVISQTTRNGIQRVWTPLLLEKEPKNRPISNSSRSAKPALKVTTDAQLPKHLQDQARLRTSIEDIMGTKVEWHDSTSRHLQISEAISATGNEATISIKNTKKLQKLYNDYTKLEIKIMKIQEKIRKTEYANSKLVASQAYPPPPPFIRQPFTENDGEEEAEEPVQASCSGCAENAPNQLAHVGTGGCLGDDELLEPEEVVDSWEDL